MQDKNHDNFFDEKTAEKSPEETLMKMVEQEGDKQNVDIEPGSKVTGTVVSIGKEFVHVKLGQKEEAVMKVEEVTDSDGSLLVKEGDTLVAFVSSADDEGIVITKSLSGRKAKTQELVDFMKNAVPVEGKVTGVNKGGFNVNILGRKAFCPFSHIDLKYVDEPNQYLMKSFSFVISRVESRGRNIVLSRLPLLEKDLSVRLEELEKGSSDKTVYNGTISKITKYGLFVNLGDFEGLVHVSEVSWDRTDDLKNNFSVGQTVQCIIKGVERKEPLRNSKISLSIRDMQDNPWSSVTERIKIGDTIEGTITHLTSFGAFVQLFPGVEGLIHISELSWSKKVRHPSEVVAKGQAVSVTIISIDKQKQSINCSLKDLESNPWKLALDKYPMGSTVKGIVASEAKYGFFIDLDEDITGLLAHARVAKEKKNTIKKGDEIEVTVDDIDVEAHRMSLSYGIEPELDATAAKEYMASQKSKPASEFGELLKAAMQKKEN